MYPIYFIRPNFRVACSAFPRAHVDFRLRSSSKRVFGLFSWKEELFFVTAGTGVLQSAVAKGELCRSDLFGRTRLPIAPLPADQAQSTTLSPASLVASTSDVQFLS